jgi:hypothetical protein
MRREVLERSVLSGLKTHLLSPELVKEFISEFHRETNRLNAERGRRSEAAKAELARVEVEIRNIIAAVKQGMVHASMQDALTQLEKRKATLACEIAATPLPPPVIHPNLAELYRRKVDRLHECLTASGTRTEAAEALRCLVDEIRLVPQDGALAIDLYGELGAILALTNDKAASGATQNSGAEQMFKALDKNKDGFVSRDEAKGTPHAKDFDKLDKNHDGKLSRAEHAAAQEHASEKAASGSTSNKRY